MENQPTAKNQALTKKVNEYTGTLTPGQSTKLDRNEIKHFYNVYLGRDPYDGQIGKSNEYKVYENHPDNKQLLKDLSQMRKRQRDQEKAVKDALQPKQPQQQQGQGGSVAMNPYGGSRLPQGQGGIIDNFGEKLSEGATNVRQKITQAMPSSQPTPTSSPSNIYPNVSNLGSGMRTDRHNNPTAFTSDVARTAGLIPNVDYREGDPFPNNPNLRTAYLLGDPIQTTIKAIDRIGFYTQAGKPRWTYINQIPGIENWGTLDLSQKANIIAQMASHEGSKRFSAKRGGQGGPRDQLKQLGNITTNFGDQTKDTNFHQGVDVANNNGTPIPKLSNIGGSVQSVGANGDYGNQVVVKNDDGTTESYSHLSQSLVQPGQRVNPQQPIAKMGATGNSWSANGGDPSHLHYEIQDAYNRYINPRSYI